jgi:hypothetical protein
MAVMIGLPWLAGVLLGFFQQLLVWFAGFIGKKLAIVAAIVAAWGVAFAALKGVTVGAIAGLQMTLPPEMFVFAGAIVPSNLGTFVAHCIGVEAACAIYKVAARILGYKVHMAG